MNIFLRIIRNPLYYCFSSFIKFLFSERNNENTPEYDAMFMF